MKKIIHGLLGALLLVSGAASAAVKSNRTFLTARDSISNNAVMNASVSPQNCKKKGMVGADITVAAYYRRSHNNSEIAQYFGAGQNTSASPSNGTIIVADDGKGATATGHHVYGASLEHTPNLESKTTGDTEKPMGGTVKFSPVREEYGANVAWNQDLSRIVDGLSMSVSAPVVGVRTNMNMTIADSKPSEAKDTDGGKGKGLHELLSGLALGKKASAGAGQKALTHAKVAWNKVQDTKFGIADVNVAFNWQFLKEADYSVDAGVHAILPTGNTATGEFLFEPIAGSGGKHFGLGASVSSAFNLWRSADKKDCLDFTAGADYTYRFNADQRRVLGVWDHVGGNIADAGHYRLTVRPAAAEAIPAANELVTDVNVTPGSQVGANAGISYRWGRWNFDAAYNLHYREAETVKVKNATGWQNDMVGFMSYKAKTQPTGIINLATTATKTVSGSTVANYWDAGTHTIGGPIQREGTTTSSLSLDATNPARYYITTKACATPSQLTHKVGGSFGYSFNTAKPVRVGMGAEYEVGSNNDSVASWALWAKLGFCF